MKNKAVEVLFDGNVYMILGSMMICNLEPSHILLTKITLHCQAHSSLEIRYLYSLGEQATTTPSGTTGCQEKHPRQETPLI